jgi:hypothetical protein
MKTTEPDKKDHLTVTDAYLKTASSFAPSVVMNNSGRGIPSVPGGIGRKTIKELMPSFTPVFSH